MYPIAVPKSIPLAENTVGLVKLETDVLPVPDGKLSKTYGGTVNCPADAEARHTYVALAPEPIFTALPPMLT
jgi:hypothetical protein